MIQKKHRKCFASLARGFICLALSTFSINSSAFDIQVYALFTNMAIVKIDGKQRKLRTGQTSPEGVKLISSDSEKAILEINGKQESYELGSQISFGVTERKQQEARIWQTRGMYITPGLINNQPVDFMVDTGASWIAINRVTAQKLGINYFYEGQQGWVSTANGTVPIYKVMLDKVKVGGIELRNVEAAILDNSNASYILLGNSFLNRVDMQREGQMMLLKEK